MDESGEKEGTLDVVVSEDIACNPSMEAIGENIPEPFPCDGDHHSLHIDSEPSTQGFSEQDIEHSGVFESLSHIPGSETQTNDNAAVMGKAASDISDINDKTDTGISMRDNFNECHTENSDSLTLYSATLTDMPLEILLHIASFLQPKVIVRSLYPVCKMFYHIFSDDHYWKTRISMRWPQKYPILDSKSDV